MTTSIDALRLRKTLGRDQWSVPAPWGPDGWFTMSEERKQSVLVTCAEHDGIEIIHASIAGREVLPTYDDLCLLHAAVWGKTGFAYQVFAPASQHVSIHDFALHLWGRQDGKAAMPEFGMALGPYARSI